jgi:hypothetical protein
MIAQLATRISVVLRTVEVLSVKIGDASSFTGICVYFLIWCELFLWFHGVTFARLRFKGALWLIETEKTRLQWRSPIRFRSFCSG